MNPLDAYRSEVHATRVLERIRSRLTRRWRLMELCGGQTHAIVRYGLDRLLPDAIELVHGPGCPVCVTPAASIDAAIALAMRPGVTLATFGDMARVPGSEASLLDARADGADVRLVYSALDALALARAEPLREVVFFAVGFETTAPTAAITVLQAEAGGIANLSLLVAHVRVPPAMEAIVQDPACAVDGFLAAGHVCAIMGLDEYRPIALRHRVPVVVTGFEPIDLLLGVERCVVQLESGRAEAENAYARVVADDGNRVAREALERVFEPVARDWRGIGTLPASGLGLREAYRRFDATHRFAMEPSGSLAATECIAGAILRGVARPHDCPAFGTRCTPAQPLGAPMVSSEGACAAWYAHRRRPVASVGVPDGVGDAADAAGSTATAARR